MTHIPEVEDIFEVDNDAKAKLMQIYAKLPQFFSEETTEWDHDSFIKQIIKKPIDDKFGKYVGSTNYLSIPNGRGIVLSPDNTSLFVGHFKHGKRHGPGRLLKIAFSSPTVKVQELHYEEGKIEIASAKQVYPLVAEKVKQSCASTFSVFGIKMPL